jgi:hypothetical protein
MQEEKSLTENRNVVFAFESCDDSNMYAIGVPGVSNVKLISVDVS